VARIFAKARDGVKVVATRSLTGLTRRKGARGGHHFPVLPEFQESIRRAEQGLFLQFLWPGERARSC